jgi:5'-3' exonuclease
MGIPSYFSFIVKNHASIIKKYGALKMTPNNLYLDCNSIIYDAINTIKFADWKEENGTKSSIIINWAIRKIEEYILLIKPNNTIYIAFDGVAPVAKLEQQRGRRYKSWYQNKITQEIYKGSKPDPWNTSAITPGTEFMNELNNTMQTHFDKTQRQNAYKVNKVIVSGSDECGEGEHKMFHFIRENEKTHKDSTTIIYGLDADLIMLSINHLPVCPNIYLFRETPHFIQSIDNTLEANQTYLLDIPELARIITLNMNNGKEMTTVQQHNRIYDYILICFMLGNDFLPHFPAINIRTGGIDKLLNAYKATIGNTDNNLTDGKQIFWNHFRKFVEALSKQEETFIKIEMKLRDKREKYFLPATTPEETFKKFEALPTYERDLEKFINPFKLYWQNRYYKSLFNIQIDDERRKQISMNYLEGLEWTMKYYTSNCPDWRWCYKHNYPPLLEDLYKNIPSFDMNVLKMKDPNPVSPYVQLCYVLPKSSLGLLPEKIHDEISKKYMNVYKNDCDFVWAYCKYFWESHVELPEIDIDELEKTIDSLK